MDAEPALQALPPLRLQSEGGHGRPEGGLVEGSGEVFWFFSKSFLAFAHPIPP